VQHTTGIKTLLISNYNAKVESTMTCDNFRTVFLLRRTYFRQ